MDKKTVFTMRGYNVLSLNPATVILIMQEWVDDNISGDVYVTKVEPQSDKVGLSVGLSDMKPIGLSDMKPKRAP